MSLGRGLGLYIQENDLFCLALAGLLILSSAVAMADGVIYNYIQAAYQEVDIDLDGGADGTTVAGGF